MDQASWRRAIVRALVWAGLIAVSICLWWLIGRAFVALGPLPALGAII
jgi:hypothetical protein